MTFPKYKPALYSVLYYGILWEHTYIIKHDNIYWNTVTFEQMEFI